MTHDEWLREFERLNGRPATLEEFQSVWGNVMPQAPSVAPQEPVAPSPQEAVVPSQPAAEPAPQVETQAPVQEPLAQAAPQAPSVAEPSAQAPVDPFGPGFAQPDRFATANPVNPAQSTPTPQPFANPAYQGSTSPFGAPVPSKKGKNGLIIGLIALLVMIAAGVGGFFWWNNNQSDAHGTWVASGDDAETFLYSEYLSENKKSANMTLEIASDNSVTLTVEADIDVDGMVKDYKKDNSYRSPSTSEAKSELEERFNDSSNKVNLDMDSGKFERTLFTGTYDPASKEITIDESTISSSDTVPLYVENGELHLNGEKDASSTDSEIVFKRQ